MQVKKYPKADLSRGSFMFFQVGLILVLSAIYFGLEWRFTATEDTDLFDLAVPDVVQEDIPITQLNNPPPPPPPPPTPQVIPEVIEVIEDKKDIEETLLQSTESNQEEKIQIINVTDVVYEEEEEEIENVPFTVVENIPIFPGCENVRGKENQKRCMSEKIDALVKREFDVGIGEEMGLTGMNRIFVIFKIDEKGEVADIEVRGPNKRLEDEAVRVVKMLPKMVPGRQRDKAVAVQYSLPIMFEVRVR